jgi:hypothetical protein
MRGQGGGPKTVRGKAASSRNSIKHGLRSDAPVIPELESFDEWERHRAGTIASFAPEGYSETDFAELRVSTRRPNIPQTRRFK